MVDISDVRLEEDDRREVLRYLGYNGQEIDASLNDVIDEAIADTNAAAEPRLIYKVFPIEALEKELSFLTGDDIHNLLNGAESVVLLSATAGMKVDMITRQTAIRDPLKSLIIDSAGSALVEAICDTAEARLRKEVEAEGKYLTWRFSPGYGDLPLAAQRPFFETLQIARIGISLNENNLMTPRKSVTAVMGISQEPTTKRTKTCATCPLTGHCRFQKAGITCWT